MVSTGAIVSERAAEAVACVGEVESVTVTVAELAPAAVGVPEIWPLLELMLKPAGNPVADQVYGVLPPVAATVVEYDVPAVPFGSEEVVTAGAAAIVSDTVADAVR